MSNPAPKPTEQPHSDRSAIRRLQRANGACWAGSTLQSRQARVIRPARMAPLRPAKSVTPLRGGSIYLLSNRISLLGPGAARPNPPSSIALPRPSGINTRPDSLLKAITYEPDKEQSTTVEILILPGGKSKSLASLYSSSFPSGLPFPSGRSFSGTSIFVDE